MQTRTISDDLYTVLAPLSPKIKKRTHLEEAWEIIGELYNLYSSITIGLKTANVDIFLGETKLTTISYKREDVYRESDGDISISRMYKDMLKFAIKKVINKKSKKK